MAARRRRPSSWSELGSYSREAAYLEKLLGELDAALTFTGSEVAAAKHALEARPHDTRPAKNHIVAAAQRIDPIERSAEIAIGASVRTLRKLPSYYGPEHIFSRAHVLTDRFVATTAQAKRVRSLLSRHGIGDADNVRRGFPLLEEALRGSISPTRLAHEARGRVPRGFGPTRTKKAPWPRALSLHSRWVTRWRIPGTPRDLATGSNVQVVEIQPLNRRVRVSDGIGNLYWVDPPVLEWPVGSPRAGEPLVAD